MSNKELDSMKKEYSSVPVPKELEFRVRQSIADSRTENAQTDSKKTHRKGWNAWTKTLSGLVAAFALITVMANSSYTISHAMSSVPVLGRITQVVTFRHYKDTEKTMSADVKTPKVVNGSKELNNDISAYTQTIIDAYKADAKATNGDGYENVQLDYKTVTDNDTLFALRFDQTISMADTDQLVKIYDVDKQTGKIISLSSLFKTNSDWKAVLTKEVKRQMRAEMKANGDVVYFIDDTDMPEFDFQTVENDTTFYVNKNGNLVLVFNKGDVAPMAAGVREFTIPSSAVASVSNGKYLS